jgi:hypothetical protein
MVKVPDWISVSEQTIKIGRHEWSVARLIELSRPLEPFDCPIDALNIYVKYDITLRQLVMHMQAVLAADLIYPIILDEDGELMDGRHRIMKAIYEGRKTIRAVRFSKNPSPCVIREE